MVFSFGGTAPTSLFGGNTSAPPAPSFGGATPAPAAPSFGGTSAAPSTSLFGGTTSAPSAPLFGATTSAPSAPLFGGTSAAPSTSLFGGTTSAPAAPSFGGASAAPSTSLFGGNTSAPPAPLFGGISAAPTTSLFGGANSSTTAPLFGGTSAAPSTSLFGGATSSTSAPLFGAPSTAAPVSLLSFKTKYEELPESHKNELKIIAQIVKESTNLRESIDVCEVGDFLEGLSQENERLRKTHGSIATALNKDKSTTESLKAAVYREFSQVEISGRIIDAESNGVGSQLMQSKHYSTILYFESKLQQFQQRANEYARKLGELEEHVRSLAQSYRPSPQSIVDTISSQHNAFMLLANQVAALHTKMDRLREQYLTYRRQYHGDLKNSFSTLKKRQMANGNEIIDEDHLSLKEYANQYVEPTSSIVKAPTAAPLSAATSTNFGSNIFSKPGNSAFSLTAPPSATNATNPGGFSFGAPPSAPSTTNTSGFSFGAPPAAPPAPSAANRNPFSFGSK